MLQAALDALDDDLRQSLELAAARIQAFHEKQRPNGFAYKDEAGVELAMRHTAVDAVGLYVPGGKAAYPSSVLMNAIPAMVAGVKRRVMVVPARDGDVNELVLAAAALAGVTEVWRIGGAQAVAALAFGTQTIAPVDKIVGPGNAFVAAAKRQVFGQVGIDSIAGPSEILVVADAHNDPAWIAADLLSQAEHDEAAQSILITDDAAFADAVDKAVSAMLPTLDRAAVAGQSWQDNGPSLPCRIWMRCRRLPTGLPLSILNLRLITLRNGQKKSPMRVRFFLVAYARGDWRLCCWTQSCFANSAHSTVFIRAWGCRFYEAHHRGVM